MPPPAASEARGIHVSRRAWQHYQLDPTFSTRRGHVLVPDARTARLLAQHLNERRDLLQHPDQTARASELHAAALLEEVFHTLLWLYQQLQRPHVMAEALEWVRERLGEEAVEQTLRRFAEAFVPEGPPEAPERALTPELALEELVTLWLANDNPALAHYRDLFDDRELAEQTAYRQLVQALHDFFEQQPPFGPENLPLMRLLHRPIDVAPHSVVEQLDYVRRVWGPWLEQHVSGLLARLLVGLDFAREEQKPAFFGPGPALVYEFEALEEQPEAFTPDRDWMPNVVLIAKNTYVWLDQISKKYGRPITRLDQIPDEELDTLARWGISGLWLIGVWERSPASKKIKQLCGNPDAEASAYAIFDYRIADALGGEGAFWNLRERAWQRGIRLAGDMVPNHMGIDSLWVMEHPDWFIYVDESPFPSYTFNGPDLSWREDIGIYIEDHYYDRTDAAVVFKRVDRRTGDVKYIYHGNDGTSMPWNDTAQLNYLKPEVREAVMQQILRVARLFPIIRFDAAMTLTKQHYQRLWFPEPGTGGAIPSRAEHGMTKAEFDRLMPREFWREVVDRVAAEAPDTLLLAEAFWLLEGYFVRTLGMHRVYNSAFMHMLRDEKNAEYRQVMKNTLAFDPEILKRYVNFMNNPDEETAVAQFGKGDKYFGVCTMMVTLPGLPMFGHGQIEGFAEKYGMEYRRAYWDEQPDEELIRRHEREIFPLLHRRHLFAGVENFLLYDLVTPEGHVDENVFAYSNRVGEERALVVYHNKFAETRGWIHRSVPFAVKGADGERHLVQKTLGEGLLLEDEPDLFCLFRDHVTGLEYIRNARELCRKGLYVELGAYQRHVFLDFRLVWDDEGVYARLARRLRGRGVPSLEEHIFQLRLDPVRIDFGRLLDERTLYEIWTRDKENFTLSYMFERFSWPIHRAYETIDLFTRTLSLSNVERERSTALDFLHNLLNLPDHWQESDVGAPLVAHLTDPVVASAVHLWAVSLALGRLDAREPPPDAGERACQRMEAWDLFRVVRYSLQAEWRGETRLREDQTDRAILLTRILLRHADAVDRRVGLPGEANESFWPASSLFGKEAPTLSPEQIRAFVEAVIGLFDDPDVRAWLHWHEYEGAEWVNKEALEQLAVALTATLVARHPRWTREAARLADALVRAGERAGYRVDKLRALGSDAAPSSDEREDSGTQSAEEER